MYIKRIMLEANKRTQLLFYAFYFNVSFINSYKWTPSVEYDITIGQSPFLLNDRFFSSFKQAPYRRRSIAKDAAVASLPRMILLKWFAVFVSAKNARSCPACIATNVHRLLFLNALFSFMYWHDTVEYNKTVASAYKENSRPNIFDFGLGPPPPDILVT